MHIKPFGEVAEVALDQAEVVCLKELLARAQRVWHSGLYLAFNNRKDLVFLWSYCSSNSASPAFLITL